MGLRTGRGGYVVREDAERFVVECIYFSACIICTGLDAENQKRLKYKTRKESVIATLRIGLMR